MLFSNSLKFTFNSVCFSGNNLILGVEHFSGLTVDINLAALRKYLLGGYYFSLAFTRESFMYIIINAPAFYFIGNL